jgi:hypothetical protein
MLSLMTPGTPERERRVRETENCVLVLTAFPEAADARAT